MAMNTVETPAAPQPTSRPLPPATLAPSIVASLLLIAVRAFEWSLMEWLTLFLAPLVALPVLLVFIGVALAALVDAVGGLWRREFRRAVPLVICLASLGAAVFVPWTPLMLDINFRLYRKDRQEVAEQVLQGGFRPNSKFSVGLLELPPKYRHLSAGGEVDVEANAVLFFTFRGVLDNFSGFVYSPSDFEPSSIDFGGDFKEVRRIREGWFWVSSS